MVALIHVKLVLLITQIQTYVVSFVSINTWLVGLTSWFDVLICDSYS